MIDWTCSQTIFGVPRSHQHCTFENFEWPSEAFKDAVGRHLIDLSEGNYKNLFITGTQGNGKTHFSVALYRWSVMWLGGTLNSAFVHVPQFISELKSSFDSKAPDVFSDLEAVNKVLVLDDLLGKNPSPWELDNVLFRLINQAYTNGASLVTTTNYSVEQMNQWLKPHEISRLLNNATQLVFAGRDRRLGR